MSMELSSFFKSVVLVFAFLFGVVIVVIFIVSFHPLPVPAQGLIMSFFNRGSIFNRQTSKTLF